MFQDNEYNLVTLIYSFCLFWFRAWSKLSMGLICIFHQNSLVICHIFWPEFWIEFLGQLTSGTFIYWYCHWAEKVKKMSDIIILLSWLQLSNCINSVYQSNTFSSWMETVAVVYLCKMSVYLYLWEILDKMALSYKVFNYSYSS